MSKENHVSEFNERFETIEDTLKFIADSQAKFEWLMKQDQIKKQKFEEKMEKFEEESQKRWQRTQKQLDYITKLTGIAFEDIMFQEDKLQKAGENLKKKKK